ncbi:flagellar FlbD family protein [Paenarthrobacter sp. Z7-10]|uniref:flagellar FlbD family protein n=1 Tax=Paenarthrobacter sp. Z7-10 TaxID=2787635 RepID=UPI0022A961A7|nr:flagellar FlbD family protein [Paenarthrobacter sp. Z7-10]MCZ2403311.1 flagellar FlbD family protein [Paenarthrobacter sp. Z7-10]
MIVVTRLDNREFAINPDLIERIHANPDTTLVMADGAKYIVTESMPEVIELIAQYRAYVIGLARDTAAVVPQRGGPTLSIVPPADPGERRTGNTVPLPPAK